MTPSLRRRHRRVPPPAAAPATVATPAETYADLCAAAREQLLGGAPQDAAQTARRALEALPRGLEAQRLLGLALLERGEARRAIATFQSALACDPLDVVAQTGIA